MNLKYIIYFLLGILIFYIFKKDNIIEGIECPLGTEQDPTEEDTCISKYAIGPCQLLKNDCGDPTSNINGPDNCTNECRGILNSIKIYKINAARDDDPDDDDDDDDDPVLLLNLDGTDLSQQPEVCNKLIVDEYGQNLTDYLIDNYTNNCKVCNTLDFDSNIQNDFTDIQNTNINIENLNKSFFQNREDMEGIYTRRPPCFESWQSSPPVNALPCPPPYSTSPSRLKGNNFNIPCKTGYVGNLMASCNEPPNYTITGSCQAGINKDQKRIDKDQIRNYLYFNFLDLTYFTESSTLPLPIEFIDHPINVNNIEHDDYTNINTYLRNSEVSIIQLNPIITQRFLDVNFNYHEFSRSWPGKGMGQNETTLSIWRNLFNFIRLNNPDYDYRNQTLTVNDIKYFLKELSRSDQVLSRSDQVLLDNLVSRNNPENSGEQEQVQVEKTPISIFMDNMDNISKYQLQTLL